MTDAMQRFLAGHWTKDRPTVAGIYPVRDAYRNEVGPSGWKLFYGTASGRVESSGFPWAGEFWSEPWPGMPVEEKR